MLGRWARRFWPLVIVGALLAAVAVMSMLGKPGIDHVALHQSKGRPERPSPTPSAAAGGQGGRGTIVETHLPAWLGDIVIYGCLVAIVAVAVLLLWYMVKLFLGQSTARRVAVRGDAGTMTRREAILAAVDDSIAQLAREDGDARAAVIACWVRLEEVAAAAGTPRDPGETPSDLVAKLLGQHQVSADVLVLLADLYRTARYSAQYIESSMRDQARAALGRLRDELRYSRSGPLADEPVDVASPGMASQREDR